MLEGISLGIAKGPCRLQGSCKRKKQALVDRPGWDPLNAWVGFFGAWRNGVGQWESGNVEDVDSVTEAEERNGRVR